uniref:Uncharacterized protein n=1 Tax=Nelumbo nucifera TaxID=4432 RepID=A0A822ZBS4_NELNU|nr:TPA_asm: hypothetical protein HUJ06_001914 [Nelumbo nucifera]
MFKNKNLASIIQCHSYISSSTIELQLKRLEFGCNLVIDE